MRFPALIAATAVVLLPLACSGDDPAEEEGAATAEAAAPPTAAAPETPAAEPPAQPMPQAQPARQPATMARVDEPYEPMFSGTVSPGMLRADVVSVWGEPVAERATDTRTYLYYRNGCEASCGTFDVVFLENGAVVDAIVRGPGHQFAGVSSSPPGREAAFTPPIPGTN